MKTEAEKARYRKSMAISIAVHFALLISCGVWFSSCLEHPEPFSVAGEMGVSFGDSDLGSGDNFDNPQNPVTDANDVEDSQPDDMATVDDPESEVIDKKPTTTTPAKPNVPQKNPNATMGEEGKGGDDVAGNKGGMNAGDGGKGSGGKGTSGAGLDLDGWDWASKPTTDDITSVGTARITFVIDRKGKILSCKATGPFTASELSIIETNFLNKTTFTKNESNESTAATLKGSYNWVFKH